MTAPTTQTQPTEPPKRRDPWDRPTDIASVKARVLAHDRANGREFPPTQWDNNQ